jgi:D-beta-D-heptose 7-phosphate kinase/D-beta-D-heptose 1-phosphate adenosyltransferase
MTVVFTNGCFDILHRGHVECLRQSKDLGDKLIVGLNSDDSVRRLKGSKRPVNKQDDRIAVLQAIRWVDEVIVFDEDTPYRLIQEVKPDIITKGGDYKQENVVGKDLARVVILPYLIGRSTTGILDAA